MIMAVRYSDQEIKGFLLERKRLPSDFWKQIRFRQKRGHQEQELDIVGDNGSQFRLILRQSNHNHLDFSIILVLCPEETSLLFRLRRYNGKSHEHTNPIERNTFYDFHIHTATVRYQDFGTREDAFAESTNRFYDYMSALDCLIKDCGFELPEDARSPLFEGLES